MQVKTIAWTVLVTVAAAASAGAQSGAAQLPSRADINAKFGKLPLTFEANRGQIDPQVSFISRGPGYSAFLTSDGMVLSLRANQVLGTQTAANAVRPSKSQKATLQFSLLGAARNPAVVGERPQSGRVNYFVGNNPAKWQRNVPTYAQVRYKSIYPGIDLLYYGNQRQLEYDFVIAPGADPGKIQFDIRGARGMHIDADGSLVLTTSNGDLHFQTPAVYQESNGQRVAVDGGYVVNDQTHISFHLAQYDPTKPLVIDPVLVYSTYLGGSGDDQAGGIAVDATGNVYVTGSTDSTDFPLTTLGSLPAGNTHVFVAKLDARGSNLIYADYIGGNSQDYGYALALDAANNVYVTGSTASSDFPMVNPFQGTYPGAFNAFLTKISPDGSSLSYSTYFGGNGSDLPSSVAVDSAGAMMIAGYTSSTNLPVANAYQSTVSANLGGIYGDYGFLTKFSPDGSSLVYSTYFGGNSNVPLNCGETLCWPGPASAVAALVLDPAGNAYITGSTNTYNFPVTEGAYQTTDSTQQNGTVGFVSKFSGGGSLQYSTYLYDPSGLLTDPTDIAVDGAGSAYVTGITFSWDGTFPITSASICDPSVYGGGCNYAFVTKFDAAAATLAYSTYLGPNNSAVPQAIVLDGNNDAYVLAYAPSGSLNTVNGIENYSNGNDLLLVEIDPAASTQLFATYLGGSGDDQPAPAGMVLDASGNIYVAGTTDSSDFPITQSAFQSVLGGNTDAFILKIAATSAPAVTLSPAALQYASQTVGSSSQPQTILLRNMGSAPLAISSITTTGDFAETDNCGNSVQAAGSCAFSIIFTPTAVGSRDGTIVIQDDAAGSPHIISLNGSGQGAVVTLIPPMLTFPSVPVGNSSAPQTITLANTGNAALSISAIEAAGDYAQTNNCPPSLSAGSSCAINVTFAPTTSGTRTGTVTVSDSVAGSPQIVGLTGTGVGLTAVVVLTPTSLVFPSTPLGTTSTSQTVTLTNTGNAALSISLVQVAGDYAQTNTCATSLSAGSSCAINVTFTPTASGSRSGAVTISDSVAGSPQIVGLTGTGVASAAVVVLTPTSLVFPSTPLGTTSTSQTATLTNTGNAALSISLVQVAGDYAQTNTCPASLSAGSSCAINVTFAPTASGIRAGTVTVRDSVAGSPQIVGLTGTGVALAAVVVLTPTSLVFPNVPLRTSSTSQTVTLTNTGNAALNISGIQVAGDYAQTNNCPSTVAAGATCTISVAFAPTTSGIRSGTVTVSDNVAGSPQSVGLSGAGSDFSLATSPASAIVKAGATASYTLTVASIGGTFANAVKLTCSGAPAKTTCGLSPSSVIPGSGTATATVTISTTGTTAGLAPIRSAPHVPVFAFWLQFQGLGLFGLILVGSKRRIKKRVALMAVALLVSATLFMSACAGGTGIGSQNQTGTTPGTYTLTVSGTSGTLQHSVPVTLTVQ
jgi:hypothetical protein